MLRFVADVCAATARLPLRRAFGFLLRIGPLTWRSGTCIREDHSSRKGNKSFKKGLVTLRFRGAKGPVFQGLLRPERAGGKRNSQAIIALAHRRCDTLRHAQRRNLLLTTDRLQSVADNHGGPAEGWDFTGPVRRRPIVRLLPRACANRPECPRRGCIRARCGRYLQPTARTT